MEQQQVTTATEARGSVQDLYFRFPGLKQQAAVTARRPLGILRGIRLNNKLNIKRHSIRQRKDSIKKGDYVIEGSKNGCMKDSLRHKLILCEALVGIVSALI